MSFRKNKITVKSEFKSRAKIIKKHIDNPEITLGDVLEAMAQNYGFKDWNTASAKLKDIPFNPVMYPTEDLERMHEIINKVFDRRRKKLSSLIKNNPDYITSLKQILDSLYYKKFEKLSIPAPINLGDFLKLDFKLSDKYIFSVNKMLANVYSTGAL